MQLEALPSDTVVIARALERVMQWLRDERETVDISASALSALSTLDSTGPLRVTALAAREGLTQPGMTTMIHRLESAGYAVRDADPDDRRAVRVTITATGLTRVAQHRDSRAVLIGSRLEQLSGSDRALLRAALPALDSFVAPAPAAEPAAAPAAEKKSEKKSEVVQA